VPTFDPYLRCIKIEDARTSPGPGKALIRSAHPRSLPIGTNASSGSSAPVAPGQPRAATSTANGSWAPHRAEGSWPECRPIGVHGMARVDRLKAKILKRRPCRLRRARASCQPDQDTVGVRVPIRSTETHEGRRQDDALRRVRARGQRPGLYCVTKWPNTPWETASGSSPNHRRPTGSKQLALPKPRKSGRHPNRNLGHKLGPESVFRMGLRRIVYRRCLH